MEHGGADKQGNNRQAMADNPWQTNHGSQAVAGLPAVWPSQSLGLLLSGWQPLGVPAALHCLQPVAAAPAVHLPTEPVILAPGQQHKVEYALYNLGIVCNLLLLLLLGLCQLRL